MALPNFDVDSISIDDLTSLMSMQWESITTEVHTSEGHASTHSTLTIPPAALGPPAFTVRTLPLLTDAEHTRLTTAGGCWKCQKSTD